MEEGKGVGDEDRSKPSSSLFPLFSAPQPPLPSAAPPSWLQSRSFTFDASALKLPEPAAAPIFPDEEEGEDPPPEEKRRSYDLVSSPSSSSGEVEKERRRRRREEKKRMRMRRKEEEDEEPRRSGVRVWEGAGGKQEKGYYFDARGDPDNLAFGSIYRMDIARYKRGNAGGQFGVQGLNWYRLKPHVSSLEGDADADVLDSVLRNGGRYYLARQSNLGQHKDFKNVGISNKKSLTFAEDFIPILDTHYLSEGQSVTGDGHDEQSWEDEVIRKTREFNKLLRESPHDESAWIEFAEFQDKVASTQRQKAARLQTLEKKIGILEKAVDLNPESEALLLNLLKSYERRDSGDVLLARWEKILAKQYGNYKLWKEFLLVVQGEFSRFKVSEVRKRYAHAVQALSSSYSRLCSQGSEFGKSVSKDPDLVQLELGLVDIFLSLCRFEWQTGFQELATGLFQAELEYSLFGPSLELGSQSRLRLFEHFWNSDGARVGEEGAIGWSCWIDKEEEDRQKILQEDSSVDTDEGGWTGWFIPSVKDETDKEVEETMDIVVGDGNDQEGLEAEDAEQEDDIETLLKKLGVNVDADHESEIKDAKTWTRWSNKETQRDNNQWMPVRESADRDEGGDHLSRSVLFEDICDYLFPLSSEEAHICLISRFIDFFRGKISQWSCSNDLSWIDSCLTLDTVPDSVSECLRHTYGLLIKNQSYTNNANLEIFLGGSNNDERQADSIKFLQNSIMLFLNIFPRKYILQEALLISEEVLVSKVHPSYSFMPSQALAKRLLKNDRQNLLLSGVYARREAAYGNIDRARKVFDMTLMCDPPSDVKEHISLLYLWYAEMEVDSSHGEESSLRAVHILSCLGGNARYTPFTGQVSKPLLLIAHNGYREQIKCLRTAWGRGYITDFSVAVVCSASLFEILTSGCKTGFELIEEALSMTLPERRSQSPHLELLSIFYIKLLRMCAENMKLEIIWDKVLQQLRTYPYSPKILSSVIEVGCMFTVPQKVRRVLDEYSQRKPSVLVYLFALLFELGKSFSHHRIRRLFERALSDDHLQKSVILWRCYLTFELNIAINVSGARRIFFRAIHACPWSKKLWLDGFQKLSSVMTANELSDLHEVMRDKELNLRTDVYEILLEDEFDTS